LCSLAYYLLGKNIIRAIGHGSLSLKIRETERSEVMIFSPRHKTFFIGAPFLLHETLGCPIANLHSARSDLWEPQFVLLGKNIIRAIGHGSLSLKIRETERSEVMIFSPQ
jgi:hypothetical protein